MSILKNRKAAVFICVVVIILSVLASARRSLAELVADTESAFVYGVNANGKSIYYDLKTRAGQAADLAVVAGRYLGDDDSRIAELRAAAVALERETSPSGCYRADIELTHAMEQVDAALKKETLTDRDEEYRRDIMTEFESLGYIISHDGYNDLVRNLNEGTLAEFPAKLLKELTFTKGAEYFG